MSRPNLKPLSKGKCLQDLKPLYDKEFEKKNISLLCKSAPKLFEAAKKADSTGSQEDSYILYMRYLSIASYVQKSDEYKHKKPDPDLRLSKESVVYALESAEKLSKSLEIRYQEKKKKEKAEIAIIPLKAGIDALEEKCLVKDNEPTPPVPERDSISCIELFQILQKDPSKVLIMDVRPRNQFSESHINFDCCISIPEEILEPGCSAAKLAEKLPEASKMKWHKRLEVEYLVLLDWLSNSSKVQEDSHLQYLQTIILKWDPSVEYRSKPLILDGGFENWLHHYPMHCTNAKPQLPNTVLNDLLDIDDVIYPDLIDEQPKFSRATKPTSSQNFTSSNGASEEKLVLKIQVEDISDKAITAVLPKPSAQDATALMSKGQITPSINIVTPNIDRSSKNAAVQKYKELEDERAKGMQLSMNLSRDREVAEKELKKLKQQQNRNELSDKEKNTLNQNEQNLKRHIQELQESQRAKDEENEELRKALEEYKSRERDMDHELSKSAGIPVTPLADIKSLSKVEKQNTLKHRLGPSTPTGESRKDLPIPSSASSLKRSRSSPNIAQLIQEPEQKPSKPQFDRNTKPIIQKPQNLEFLNRHRNFQEVYGNVKQGLTGLRNLGNSCYMNSILQCISNINILVNYFCSGKYKEDLNRSPLNPTRGEVAEEVAQVIRHLWYGQYRSIACRDLKNVVGKHMDQFRGCGQQDAHEFLTFLMDWLHNDLKLQKEEIGKEVSNSLLKKNSEIDAITGAINTWNDFKSKHESFMLTGFFIQQVSTVQCSSCHAKSMNFEEPTSNLTLLLPSAARCMLSDCLRLYTNRERISGYKCESCHGLHDAEKSVDLCRLPPILIIHLKRFYSDGFYQKRQTFVDFPLENLDMKNYTPDRHQSHTVYNLCGVSNHYGTLEGGHYTAYCKNGTKWYKFDDQDISEISREDVKSASAYILFYAAVR